MPTNAIVQGMSRSTGSGCFNYITKDAAPAPDTIMLFFSAFVAAMQGGFFESYQQTRIVPVQTPGEACALSMFNYITQDATPAPDTQMIFLRAYSACRRSVGQSLMENVFGVVVGDVNCPTNAWGA